MNINKLGIIISREYLNKVKKKSFLLITFLSQPSNWNRFWINSWNIYFRIRKMPCVSRR